MKDFRTNYGEYAIVTGASSGIGEQFAWQLAAAGVDLILVARRRDRLEALAADLTRAHGTVTRVISLDLLADGAVNQLHDTVRDLDVGMVVANAGIYAGGRLIDNELECELDILTLNTTVPLQLAHRFGRDFAQRGRGAIVLVSSLTGAAPTPYVANYAAAKGYVALLGQALNYELRRDGVDVLVVCPGATQTEGLDNAKGIDFHEMGAPMMDPAKVARAALTGLGRRARVVPGALNVGSDLIGKYLMPRSWSVRLYGFLIGRAVVDEFGRAA
ncbi:SDR family NAD(P)-dependent oxidoreductase [Mycolicibacterium goodii]|uniref:SDR family NAD(P)-dependent oxidoreductase n=1 Tax=Mycolicibacterium goodii TaxID=134601 RepID=UPI001BDD621C|nr:SDR family NAD(P)-dependent oxidoreductase [Mycolicibacterium goodii]MBU8828766.1 SDR family NAD(P)-dependent oxidoreductase [Mycolicibacterium goodii]